MNKEQALQKAGALLRKNDPNYSGTFGIEEVEGVGYRIWQEARGGGTVIVGHDGGVLISTNMTYLPNLPQLMIQAYKEGKRTPEDGSDGTGEVTKEQVLMYVQTKFNEADSSDRVEDRGFAFFISTLNREITWTPKTIQR